MTDESNEMPSSSGHGKVEGREHSFVVGIGASAGGISALREFFRHVKSDSGMTYVVILHLSPEHESNLASLLQSQTSLPVTQVTETVRVEPNHIYVIPPANYLAMSDGVIRLTPPEKPAGGHNSIDVFFRTLADAYGRDAIAVLLSGAGSDGTLGLGRIKEQGGIVIVQDPAEAEYHEMPRSAIETLLVDLVLPVAEIPSKLISLRDGAKRLVLPKEKEETPAPAPPRNGDALREILALVRVRTGNDFSQYKRPTILRRIARRMQVNEVHTITDYSRLLREQPQEISSLLRDLLITVTSFFRDHEYFDVLAHEVIPNLFAKKTRQQQVRVWSVGCATGEEAYSLGMLLVEHAERLPDPPGLQIFATDIDERAIAEARECKYPASISLDVSPERLRRFFSKEGERYRIVKSLREMVLFAHHNILRDPPFSRIDLISCRNVLIYLNRDVQERILGTLHFSLRPDGYLFLGSAEAADVTPKLFAPVDKKRRIYVRRAAVNHPTPALEPSIIRMPPKSPDMLKSAGDFRSMGELHQESVELFAPPSVLANEEYEVVHASAHAGRYLHVSGGVPALNLLKLIHPDLRIELRSLLLEAKTPGKAGQEQSRQVQIDLDGKPTNVLLRVRQLIAPETARGFFLVIFDEGTEDASASVAHPQDDGGQDRVARHLEEELQRTKDQLRLTIEQYETSTEELRASNEELQAINEELRSATEELETSKEELQSVNEELTTVNHEYREKLEEIGRANADLQNLMASTDIGTIFLDRDLRIKRYTPRVQQLFSITQADIGRPLEHFTSKLEYSGIHADALEVLRTLNTVEREIRSQDGKWFLMQLVPYRTIEDRIDGVVLTFVDVTNARENQERLREQARVISLAHVMMRSASEDVIMLWNEGCERLYGYTAAEAVGKKCHELLRTEFPQPLEQINAELEKTGEWQGELVQETRSGSRIFVASHWVLNRGTAEKPATVLEVNNDVTMRHVAEEALRVADRNKDQFLAMLAHELRNPVGAMLNSLELLNTSKRSADASLARGVIERQLHHLMRLVDDLLDVERLTHGKISLVRRRVALSEIVEAAAETCKSLIDTSQHKLKINLPRKPIFLRADATRLAQVFSNLLHNALKYTPAGGSIELSAERSESQVEVKIQDTGIGISPEILPRLFEMYAQGEPLSGSEMKGLGVGLALVRQIVQLHGGTVSAHSEGINRGSQFVVSLPLPEEHEDAEKPSAEPRAAARSPSVSRPGKRVMIVDDNRDASEALAMLLQRSGYITHVFSDGASAMDAAREFEPHAAVLDVGLPGMNGYELARKLRESFPNIVLIALSGWRQDETAVHETVFDSYLIKPAGIQEIEKLLSRI
jgi:two-component system CheB/CheR fusion protein